MNLSFWNTGYIMLFIMIITILKIKQINGYTCLDNPNGCQACTSNMYILKNQRCQKIIPNCQLVDEQGQTCIQCIINFKLTIQTKQCINETFIKNCQVYTDSKNCKKCYEPYKIVKYYNSNYFQYFGCHNNLVKGCKIYQQLTGYCNSCQSKLLPYIYYRIVYCYLPNCVKQIIQNETDIVGCEICKDEYELSPSRKHCIIINPNCSQYKQNQNQQCIACQQGYKLATYSNQCIPDNFIPNCQIYYSSQSCSKCIQPYQQKIFYDFNILTTECILPQIQKCSLYKQNSNICIQCIQNYQISFQPNKCLIPHCQVYQNSTLKCYKCEQGYQKTQIYNFCILKDQKCIQYNQFHCIKCQQGYKLTYSDHKCVNATTIPNCIEYYFEYYCHFCQQSYRLVLIWKYPRYITKCVNDYNYNCDFFNQLKQCLFCRYLYTFNSNHKCAIQNCKIYQNSSNENYIYSYCQECQQGFQLLRNKTYCQKYQQNCIQYQNSTYNDLIQCIKCQQGYILTLHTHQCILIDHLPNCQIYSRKYICNKCIYPFLITIQYGIVDGQYRYLYKCQSKQNLVQNCDSYQIDTFICNVCQWPYSLNSSENKCYIPNCLIYQPQNSSYCKQCKQGYNLSKSQTTCRIPFNNCAIYQQYRKLTCYLCKIGDIKTIYSQCVKQNISNCQTYFEQNDCHICKLPYQRVSMKKQINGNNYYGCVKKKITKCNLYEKDTEKCLGCQKSYIISIQSNQCSILNCQIYKIDDIWQCDICREGYKINPLNSAICLKNIFNCIQWNYLGQKCINCQIGFNLQPINKTFCFKRILHCQIYSIQFPFICQICSKGFQISQSKYICRKPIKHCITYDPNNQTQCIQCRSIVLSIQSSDLKMSLIKNSQYCLKCNISKCKICQSNISCGICQNGFKIYKNLSSNNKLCILCNIQNCKLCSKQNLCLECQKGFVLVNNQCKQCRYPCQTCKINLSCQTCQSPLFQIKPDFNNNCLKNSVTNCLKYQSKKSQNETKICKQCLKNFKLDQIKNKCERKCPVECSQCQEYNKCTICQPGYFKNLSSGICQRCSQNCNLCESLDVCYQAVPGFFIIQRFIIRPCPYFCKICQSYNNCLVLKQAYLGNVIVQIDNKIKLISCQIGCQICNPMNIYNCLKCKEGFYNIEGKCKICGQYCKVCNNQNPKICLTCFPNTFLFNQTCLKCSENCLTCLGPCFLSVCLSCKKEYYLSAQTCIRNCSKNCNQCQNFNKCLQCKPGYTLIDNLDSVICIKCKDGCANCIKGQPQNCVECKFSSYLSLVNNRQKCISCSVNCITCTQKGCTQCLDGFYLNENLKCTKNCIQPCLTCFAEDPSKCLSCLTSYSLDSINYHCNPEICNQNCEFCPDGFTINEDNKCIKCLEKNCRSCSVTNLFNCESCIKGYYLNQGRCLKCSKQCTTCLQYNKCTSCQIGYVSIQQYQSLYFTCLSCAEPCKTCFQSQTKCLSCIDKYQKVGLRCIHTLRYNFSLTLNIQLSSFRKKMLQFLIILNQAVGGGKDTDKINLIDIMEGSVILNGVIQPVENNLSISNTLNGIFQKGQIAGMQVTSYQLDGILSEQIAFNQSNQLKNMALILGISIPLIILDYLKKQQFQQQEQ